jgi:hypothetical protein
MSSDFTSRKSKLLSALYKTLKQHGYQRQSVTFMPRY